MVMQWYIAGNQSGHLLNAVGLQVCGCPFKQVSIATTVVHKSGIIRFGYSFDRHRIVPGVVDRIYSTEWCVDGRIKSCQPDN